MKKIIFTFLTILSGLAGFSQTINYTFAGVAGAWTANAAPTVLIAGAAAGRDDVVSASTAIGFNFSFGCRVYTTFQASTNGVMFLGTTGAAANGGNDLTGCTDRPILAPLWDDLETGATTGEVNYKLTGTAPNRVLTIEWKQMNWNYTSTTWAIEFQVKLYETSNRVEFIYNRNGGINANITGASASIGIGGLAAGDFYSLNGVGVTPTASKVTETTTLSQKPASGQIYRWDPVVCSGAPTPGSSVATPTIGCTNYTSTLTLSGATSACGLTYQWQSATAVGGPYTAIAGATLGTATVTVPGSRFYRCVIACGASSATSTPVQATTGNYGIPVTLPYSSGAATTCGAGDNLTYLNPTICGSDFYYDGEDVTYNFTPTTSGLVNINLSTAASSTGLMLYDGCPTLATANCVNYIQSYAGSKQLCATLTAGVTYYLHLDSYPSPACYAYSVTISAPTAAASATCNMAYTAASTTFSIEAVGGTALPTTDDVLFNSIINFGFPVCFDGAKYYGGYVASNASFVFDAIPCFPNLETSTYASGGAYTGYTIPTAAPSATTSVPRNAILAPWHDIDPSVVGGSMTYTTVGTAPNRRCIITFSNIPMYSCNAKKHTSQIKIYETTNTIEIHIKEKDRCNAHNNGAAVLGLLNFDGTKYVPPVNPTIHNNITSATSWTMVNTAYRFTTACGTSGGVCLTLPIGFTNFYAERVDYVNHLYWETASESDLKKFTVQRSTDGINFVNIGQVNPNNSPSKYSFDDTNAPVGMISYYRVEVLENSGVIEYTDIYPLGTGVNELLNVSQIFPNPTSTKFVIAFDSKKMGDAMINVFDIYGKLVKVEKINLLPGVTRTDVDVEELQSGVYYVEVINNLNEIITKQKLIIQK